MKYDKPVTRSSPEQKILDAIRSALQADGWLVEKMHGNQFQSGIPDLYCFHREHGHRWVEIKTPKGRLTAAQAVKFPKWDEYGLDIWVLQDVNELPLLFETANWKRMEGRVTKHKNTLLGHKKGDKVDPKKMMEWKEKIKFNEIFKKN